MQPLSSSSSLSSFVGAQGPARVRARRDLPARPLLEGQGAGPHHRHPGHSADGAGGPAHHRHGRAHPGRHLPGQRLGQGQRGGLLPGASIRRRPSSRWRTTWRPPASSPRPPCARCWASTSWTRCWPSATGSTTTSARSSTSRRTPGASRSPTWRSSTWTWTRA